MTDRIQLLAADTVCVGRLNEPRAYFDTVTVPAAASTSEIFPGASAVFRNNEDFPVQIKYLIFGTNYVNNELQPSVVDERYLARVGLRIRQHDHYYMSRQFVSMPLWSNVVSSAPISISNAGVTWRFTHPCVLSARDTLRVRVSLATTPTTPRTVRVAFHGTGRLTSRPYFFESEIALSDTVQTTMDTAPFRNDGAEPVDLFMMVANVSAEATATDPTGDSRAATIQINQIGNGTNADWFKGPIFPVAIPRPQIELLGSTLGRAIVHQLPGSGWIWEPGEGCEIDLARLGTLPYDLPVSVSMLGHISVT